MATRSTIGYFENGILTSVYCHWDGYLRHNGVLLNENYNTLEKVKELVSFGNISSLKSKIGERHPFETYNLSVEEKQKFENFTTFYGRDRGETSQRTRIFLSYDDYFNYYNDCGCEYFYVFSQGEWFYANYADNASWRNLSFDIKDVKRLAA